MYHKVRAEEAIFTASAYSVRMTNRLLSCFTELDAGHFLPTRPVRCLTRPAGIYKISTRPTY
jgi:hypothetical protein